MKLPADLTASVEAALGNRIERVTMLPGGSINLAARLQTGGGKRAFLKWKDDPPLGFFQQEAEGLNLLRQAAEPPLIIPEVLGVTQGFLLLEYIPPGEGHGTAEALGTSLASLHRVEQERFGLGADNFIGRLAQPNGWSESWVAFYRDKRLVPQREMLRERGLLPAERERRLDALINGLEDFLEEPEPSVLHGDLWGGNWMASVGGAPVLIDPAAYIGHREVDLAMTGLFGGFPRGFYRAYNREFPLPKGYNQREPVYQLYYLLVHINHFGKSYGPRTDAVLARLVG